MELLLSILAVIFVLTVVSSIFTEDEFYIKIKEIEDILNSPDARKRKYELFDKLGELSNSCTNYSDLSKLQELLGRVYDL